MLKTTKCKVMTILMVVPLLMSFAVVLPEVAHASKAERKANRADKKVLRTERKANKAISKYNWAQQDADDARAMVTDDGNDGDNDAGNSTVPEGT